MVTLATEGKTNNEMASTLFVSVKAVDQNLAIGRADHWMCLASNRQTSPLQRRRGQAFILAQ